MKSILTAMLLGAAFSGAAFIATLPFSSSSAKAAAGHSAYHVIESGGTEAELALELNQLADKGWHVEAIGDGKVILAQ